MTITMTATAPFTADDRAHISRLQIAIDSSIGRLTATSNSPEIQSIATDLRLQVSALVNILNAEPVPEHLKPECGDTCCPGVDSASANRRHSYSCDLNDTEGCWRYMDDRYHEYLHGTPDDTDDGWACPPCRVSRGWSIPTEAGAVG